MNRNILSKRNEDVTYCDRCAKYTAEVIEETEKQINTLCGICGRLRSRRKDNVQKRNMD